MSRSVPSVLVHGSAASVGIVGGCNSESGPGRRTTDTLPTTGISVKFE